MFAPCINDKHFIIQQMHKIVDIVKIIKYLKVLLHFSDQKGCIFMEPYTVLG